MDFTLLNTKLSGNKEKEEKKTKKQQQQPNKLG